MSNHHAAENVMQRTVPADINAERATLGAILLERDAIIGVADWLTPDYFYLEKHAWIYEAMLACYHRRIPPDISTVASELRRYALPQPTWRQEQAAPEEPPTRLGLVGGIAYLGELSAEVPTAVHVEYYGRIVERTAILRRLIECGGKITAMGYDEREELETTLEKAESALFDLLPRRHAKDFRHMLDIGGDYFDSINIAREQDTADGIATGYHDLDMLTGGLQPSDLVILAARPGTGKTALALSIMYDIAFVGKRVGMFSLEMSEDQVYQRILAMHTGIPTDVLRKRKDINSEQLDVIARATGPLTACDIWIDDTPGINIAEARSKARRLHVQHPFDLVVVDYIQRMTTSVRENRVQQIGDIVRGLKSMARELQVPVLVLSQLSRQVEGRINKVPVISDLRESGDIEQEADVVMMLYREEMYDKETDKQGIAEIHIAKHRNGPLGMARLYFDKRTTRFQNLARDRTPDGY
jgi:replicative DNA helicase